MSLYVADLDSGCPKQEMSMPISISKDSRPLRRGRSADSAHAHLEHSQIVEDRAGAKHEALATDMDGCRCLIRHKSNVMKDSAHAQNIQKPRRRSRSAGTLRKFLEFPKDNALRPKTLAHTNEKEYCRSESHIHTVPDIKDNHARGFGNRFALRLPRLVRTSHYESLAH